MFLEALRLEIENFIKKLDWRIIGFWADPEDTKYGPGSAKLEIVNLIKGFN